ncbi:MAG TPA: bifunctional oligoribonuclease/PAP phosphatase NrnA [Thermodesulfobacteriota bacterium]|nr:bifunctional oligoribonuclease/PAP phosphatase NrnA [Thermodesulfobacteriota bacterium]
MSDLERIIDIIRGGKRFLITSHENPDGDAIGSMLALGLSLEQVDKEIVYYNKDGTPAFLKFLSGGDRVFTSLDNINTDFDATFVVDCTDTGRAGGEFEKFQNTGRCGIVIIIDHHQTTRPSADLYLLNPQASSTGMIIYSLLKALSVRLNSGRPLEIAPDIANCIYTTILVDTGSFRYSNTNEETFKVAAELLQLGVNPPEIAQALFENEPLKKIKLLGLVLPTLEITEDGQIASVFVDREMFKSTGTSRVDTDGIINLPRSIEGVEVAVLFREEEPSENGTRWKVSLRSKGRVNVAQIAEKFDGGGHERAAGFSVFGTLPEAKRSVFNSISEALK